VIALLGKAFTSKKVRSKWSNISTMKFRAAAAPKPLSNPGTGVDIHDLQVELGGSPILELAGAQLEPGKALAVTGRNGAGKTTLLRVVSGMAKPSAGVVSVFGIAPDEHSKRFRELVATQLSVPPLASDLTLIEHLMLVGVSWGLTADAAIARGEQMLRRFDLEYMGAFQQTHEERCEVKRRT
jgi:ABC-2 type transport system ATP-binding protein